MPTTMKVNASETLVARQCWCGIWYAMPENLYRQHMDNGHATYCPLGHSGIVKVTRAEELAQQLERANAQLVAEQDQRVAAERRVAAARGQVTKIKNRVKNGVCPFCKRSFPNVARHMESKHPGEEHEASA